MYLQDRLIDYDILAKACSFYRCMGFQQIEVDWMIESRYAAITVPRDQPDLSFALRNYNHLLYSAEQGLIKKAMLGQLVTDKTYFSVSPCFRQDLLDDTHSQTFMKLELFSVGKNRMNTMTWCAQQFFGQHSVNTEIVSTAIGQDLMYAGELELGSYGVRCFNESLYISYGTGLALPRFSLAQELSDGRLSY